MKMPELYFEQTSDLLGKLKFKGVTLGDIGKTTRLLKEIENDREFVARLLHNQLVEPAIPFEEFSTVPDPELIRFATSLAKRDDVVFRHFKKDESRGFFSKYRQALTKRYEEYNQLLGAIARTDFSFDAVRQTLSTLIPKHESSFESAARNLSQISSFAQKLQESLTSFQHSFAPVLQRIADRMNWYFQYLSKRFDTSIEEIRRVLKKYRWFLSPSVPYVLVKNAIKIGKLKENQRKLINLMFVTYYCSDDFKILMETVDSWKINPLFKPRMKILRDCVQTLRAGKGKFNACNVVLPTLIAQVDGIGSDFLKTKGYTPNRTQWKDPSSGRLVSTKEGLQNTIVVEDLYEEATYILLDVLFQTAYPGQQLSIGRSFSRHKILHGEALRYGTIDNVVRAFLILDWLSDLK